MTTAMLPRRQGIPDFVFEFFSGARRDLADTINSVLRQFPMNVLFRVVAFTFCWYCFFVFPFFVFVFFYEKIHSLQTLITNHHQSYTGSPNVSLEALANTAAPKIPLKKKWFIFDPVYMVGPLPVTNGV